MKIRLLLPGTCLALLFITTSCITRGTPSGAIDPEGTRLAQAYHILAKCDRDCDDHIAKAMDLTEKAANVLGVDVHAEGIEDRKEGDCVDHLRTAREMIRIAHDNLPVTGEKRAVVTAGSALREVSAALECIKG